MSVLERIINLFQSEEVIEKPNMNTQIYGQVPVFSREQVRKLYANAVKSGLEQGDTEQIVEKGVMPFPSKNEIKQYQSSVVTGLDHALGMIEEQYENEEDSPLPALFMIDTGRREGSKAPVWIVHDYEIMQFSSVHVTQHTAGVDSG